MPRKKRKKQVEGVGGLWSMRRVGRRYVSECELSTEMVVNVSTCCTPHFAAFLLFFSIYYRRKQVIASSVVSFLGCMK